MKCPVDSTVLVIAERQGIEIDPGGGDDSDDFRRSARPARGKRKSLLSNLFELGG